MTGRGGRSLQAIAVSWGDVPTWLSSLATFVALIFAAVAAVSTRKLFKLESDRDYDREETKRQAQAAVVSAWWGESKSHDRSGIFVRNASAAPVYQAHLTVLSPDGASEETKLFFAVVPPRDEAEFHVVDMADASGPGRDRHLPRRVKAAFTDAAGIRWLRDKYGRLVKLEPELFVRADHTRTQGLARFAEDFQGTHGVKVSFETYKHRPPYSWIGLEEAKDRDKVDAFVGPHDWIGELVRGDVIEPTVLSADGRQAFPSWMLDALTFEGRLYGLPTTLDTVALIRNTDLAPDPPETLDELIATGVELRRTDRTTEVFALRIGELGDPYQIWPLFTSAGGALFGRRSDGTLDPAEVLLATDESIAAFERLRELGEAGSGMLRRNVDRETALELFTTGRTPYLISTSTPALLRIREAGLPAEVTSIPPFAGGQPAKSFTTVLGVMFVKLGPNKTIAHDLFADYLTDPRVASAYAGTMLSPTALLAAEISSPAVRRYRELCDTAIPMPTFPHMRTVWRLLGEAEAAVVAGADPTSTATRLAEDVASASASTPRS